MKGYNLIVVFNETADKVLLCKRRRDPYKGLSNFVGGKIEQGEEGLAAAYRELWEETSIPKENIALTHFIDFTYHTFGLLLEVYVGKIKAPCAVDGDENELYWSSLDENFFDATQYAGEGNMRHILMEIGFQKEALLR